MTQKKVNIRQAVIIGEALFHLPEGTTRRNALFALRQLTTMLEEAEAEIRRIEHREAFQQRIEEGS